MPKGNILIGQSGGPTAVINASMAGLLSEISLTDFAGRALGLPMGLEGLLGQHEPVELGHLSQPQLTQLAHTGGAVLGSSRVRPGEQELAQALAWLKRYDVRYFAFVGGNGSLQTPLELERLARAEGYELYCVGVPKTIDNDLVGTDHAPGYGSAALWLAMAAQDSGLDLYTMRGFDQFKVLETMGRHTGWLAAATSLARNTANTAPHLILVPEQVFEPDAFLAEVEQIFRREGCVLVVVAEGVRNAAGQFLAEINQALGRDALGKSLLSIGEGVSGYLCQLVKTRLGLKVRYDKPGTLQRGAACVSPIDRAEAWELGSAAARYLLQGQSGIMPALRRLSTDPYHCEIVPIALSEVVGREKTLPPEFLHAGGLDEDAFRRYAAPLIGPPLLEPWGSNQFSVVNRQ